KKLNLVNPEDNILSILPLHHSYAFLVSLIIPLLLKIKITYLDSLKPTEILKCLNSQRITLMAVVPQILYLFYRPIKEKIDRLPFCFRLIFNLSLETAWVIKKTTGINLARLIFYKIHSLLGKHLRFFICGGAKLNEEVSRLFFKLGFKIIEGYGLTEASPVVSLNPPNKIKIGSVGKPIPDVKVKILKPHADKTGQILIKGDNLMAGYYRNEKETAKTLKDGWLYSGDTGFIDRGGYLYIRSRIKETIVLSSGKNISPEEVEAHYLKSPFIKEICVLADEKEETLAAVVVPDLPYFKKTKEPNVSDVIKWNLAYLSEKLPPYKRIRDFVIVEEALPKTLLGKTQRFKIRQIYKEYSGRRAPKKEIIKEQTLSSIAKKILKVIEKTTGKKGLSLSDHLELDLGLDSLKKIEIMLALEQILGITLKEENFSNIFTIEELINKMEEMVPALTPSQEKERIFWKEILAQEPPSPLKKTIDLSPSLFTRLFTSTFAIIINCMARIFFGLKVYGKTNLPRQNFILCPNHTSYLDGFLIFTSLPLKLKHKLFFLGLSAYFQSPIIKRLTKYMKVVPIDYARNLLDSMKVCSYILENKKVLCIFPEGTRSVDGQLKEFKKGIGILTKELDAKIIPVYIKGSYQAWKPSVLFPRPHPIKVTFGKPRSKEQLKETGLLLNKDADTYQAISLGIRQEVAKLKETL
ncbi:MAG: AMP-binding protein, partial [Candidatus Omnitrophota bacterium]